MNTVNEKEFLLSVKNRLCKSLIFLYGTDEYTKEICLKKFLSSIDGEFVSFDGQCLDLNKLYEECCSMSFFSSAKKVVVRNPDIEHLSSSQEDLFYKIFTDKSPETYLVFIEKNNDNLKKNSSKRLKFIKTVSEEGMVIECAEKSTNDIVSMIIKTAQKNGCTIDKKLAVDISERCLNTPLLVSSNLNKLLSYAKSKNNGVITEDAVENLVSRQLDYKSYEISKNILNNKFKQAMKILDSLILSNVDEIAINSAISSSFIDIYRVKIMNLSNKSCSDLFDVFNYKGKEFRIKNAGYDLQKCSLDFLKKSIISLSKADVLLKSSKCDKKIILEKTLSDIFIYKQAVK